MTVTAQETTTLPEGAVVTVMKWEQSRKNGGMSTGTTLHVHRGDKELEMRCDGVSPANLKQYMDLMVREINRRRSAMTGKPMGGSYGDKPKDIKEFVDAMAINDMFVFDALQVDPSMHTNDVVAEANGKPKPKRRRKAKDVPTNGNTPS